MKTRRDNDLVSSVETIYTNDMKQLSTTELRRDQPGTMRRVIAGQPFELTNYGKPIGVCVVPRSKLIEMMEAQEAARREAEAAE